MDTTALPSGQIKFLRAHPHSRPVTGMFGTLFVYEHCDGKVTRYTIAPSGRLLSKDIISTSIKRRAGKEGTSESGTLADLEDLWQTEPYVEPSSD